MRTNYCFILIIMIFMHIVDDYYLQGWLSSAKQKSWWLKNSPNDMYKNDYIVALLCHGYSWSFMTSLPLAIYNYNNIVIVFIIINTLIHSFIDNYKANKLKINLIQDQLLHFMQIVINWSLYYIYLRCQ